MDSPKPLETFEYFQGHETRQRTVYGEAARPAAWYFEPKGYEGDILWSAGFLTKEEAIRASYDDPADAEE